MSGTTVKYSNYTLEIALHRMDRIDVAHFTATSANYMTKLRERGDDMSDHLRALIAKLFQQKVVTHCKITYGDKMVLTLAKKSPQGRTLLALDALRQFQETFDKLTGLKHKVDWEASGKTITRKRRRRSRLDPSSVFFAIVDGIDAVLDGFILAGAIKELFGKD